jgi:threonine/homoserine/homoserine lactone efflux protein
MNHELVIAAMLGLIGGVIPGPVITAVFTEILQSGFFKSLRIIFLAFIVESLVAIVSLVVFFYLGLPEVFFRAISLAGAGILAWISFSIWKVRSLETGERISFGSWKIILMILTNGVLWTYWLTICIPKAILLNEQVRLGAYLFMGFVQLGWLLSTVVVAFVFMRFRPLLSRPRVVAVVFKIFSLAFLYFAIDMIYKSIAFFISKPQRQLP